MCVVYVCVGSGGIYRCVCVTCWSFDRNRITSISPYVGQAINNNRINRNHNDEKSVLVSPLYMQRLWTLTTRIAPSVAQTIKRMQAVITIVLIIWIMMKHEVHSNAYRHMATRPFLAHTPVSNPHLSTSTLLSSKKGPSLTQTRLKHTSYRTACLIGHPANAGGNRNSIHQNHRRFIIQRGHENTRTGNGSEGGFGLTLRGLWVHLKGSSLWREYYWPESHVWQAIKRMQEVAIHPIVPAAELAKTPLAGAVPLMRWLSYMYMCRWMYISISIYRCMYISISLYIYMYIYIYVYIYI